MIGMNRKVTTYYHRCRLYSKNEIFELLKKVGLKKVAVVGDCLGNKFEETKSTHPYYFASK